MAIHVRGVSRLKTISAVRSNGARAEARHARQFQIAFLELEHSRRVRDKQTAIDRIKALDSRLVEINVQIRKLQDTLGTPHSQPTPDDKPVVESPPVKHEYRRTLRY